MTTATSTRERLIDAAERIIREHGLQAVTTKDVAREAGFAEATIYRHFADKTELMLQVLRERIPAGFLALIHDLPHRAGTAAVAANLELLATAAVAFFVQTAPLTAALGADPALAARHYARLRELGSGPDAAQHALVTYLAAEQRLGRVDPSVNPVVAAHLLLGICFTYGQIRHLSGSHPTGLEPDQFVPEIVQTLLTGLTPPPADPTASDRPPRPTHEPVG